VVMPGQTGVLVDLKLKEGTFDPIDPAQFSHDLAAGINQVALDSALRQKFGANGRKRVEDHFSWTAIAQRTLELYRSLV
jgi:alpha-maltose-1-phosphate synthase